MAAVGKHQQAETEAQQQRQQQVVLPVRHLQNKPRQRLRYLMCRTKNDSKWKRALTMYFSK